MPKRVDLEGQRRGIAAAAVTVIGAVGVDGVRLRDVAAAAGVTTGAVTHYFDGKDAVLEAALAEAARRILERQAAGSAAGRVGDVGSFVRTSCRYLPLDEEGLREWRVWLAFWGRAITDDRLRARHRAYYDEFVAGVMRLLAPLRTETQPTQAHLRRTADAVIAAIDGIGVRATLEPEQWSAKRQRDTLTAQLTPLITEFAAGD